MKPWYVMWVVFAVFCIVYSMLIFEEFVPVLKLKTVCSVLLASTGLLFALAAKIFDDGEKNGNKDEN